MKTLKLVFISMIISSVVTANPIDSNFNRVPFYIYNAATHFGIDVDLMYALCQVESNCKARAINHNDGNQALKAAGVVIKSYGMFQIQIPTAVGLGFVAQEKVTVEKLRKGKLVKVHVIVDHSKDLLKPEINSWYAAKLLHMHYKKYGSWAKAISAYNNGFYSKRNNDYVSKVLSAYAKLKLDKRL